MANDATKAKTNEPIKNGTAVVTCNPLGKFSKINTYASPLPDISAFQSKYDSRFDDPTYYYDLMFVKPSGA